MGEGVCDGSAHVKSCFFFLDVYFCSLTRADWVLRTRHKLAFSFGRVLWFSGSGGLGAPHTSQTCFFFLGGYFGSLTLACWALRTRHKLAFSFWAGAFVLWLGRAGRSAHVTNLLFLFGRVLWFSDVSLLGAPHTSQTRFFFLGGYFGSLARAGWVLRTRHKLAFSFWRVLPVLRSCLSRKIPFRHDPSRKKPPPHTHISHNRSLLTTQKPSPALRAGLGPKLPRLP